MKGQIESGIPMPPAAKVRKWHYPFAPMDVGDSFSLGKVDGRRYRLAASSAYEFGKRHGRKFAIRKMEDGTSRIWRVE